MTLLRAVLLPLLLAHAALWSRSAAAAGTWRGIPVSQLGELGLKTPSFESASEGWTAQFPKGLARVYVAPQQADLSVWMAGKQALLARRGLQPLDGLGDAAWAAGDGVVLVQSGNVGLLVETTSGARAWAEGILGALVPGDGSWPDPPLLVAFGSEYEVQAPGAVHLSYRGGEVVTGTPAGTPLRFHDAPAKLVAWDAWGRASVAWFDEQGNPAAPLPDPMPLPSSGGAAPRAGSGGLAQ